jgi:hypothetical protein
VTLLFSAVAVVASLEYLLKHVPSIHLSVVDDDLPKLNSAGRESRSIGDEFWVTCFSRPT